MGKVVHQLLLPPAAWLACALDRRLASASVSSKAIIAILSKTRPIARMLFSLSISFPPPTFRERCHGGLTALSIAVRGRAILVLPKSQRPHPRRPYRRRVYLQDTADYGAIGEHVVIILIPFRGRTHDTSRGYSLPFQTYRVNGQRGTD
jgi:hypothetical protein